MLLLEYEAKALLQGIGIAVPAGTVLRRAENSVLGKLQYPVAMKAQVAAGGRGKAGGVIRADSAAQAEHAARRLFGSEIGGERPRAVLAEAWLPIERELYLCVTVDAHAEGYAVLFSPHGGVDVEHSEPPVRYGIGRLEDYRAHRLRELLRDVEPDPAVRERAISIAGRLVLLARRRECVTVEINPLAVLADGSLVAADAKIVSDDNAAFRCADIGASLARSRRHERRPIARALAARLAVVWLDGEIGLISGGAGMTMASMDLIADAGARPACFLDCSENPTLAGYTEAFKLLDQERQVKVILVSIFGGLTQMDRVARVMDEVMRRRKSKKPVVFRLNGTNAEKANGLLASAGMHNHESLEGAIQQAVALSRQSSPT